MTVTTPPTPDVAAPPIAARRSLLRPGWPLTALLVLYPLWWALGLGTLILFALCIPMTLYLVRNRPIRVPHGFGLWLLFLLWVLISVTMIGQDPPQALPGAASDRLISVAYNVAGYAVLTIFLLYAGNLTERDYPRERMVRQLAFLFVVTVVGGLVGTFIGQFEFTSPVELLLPAEVRADGFVRSIVHPSTAQVQDVLGYEAPRPAAPFGYTNSWGFCLSVLLGFFVVGWFGKTGRARKIAGVAILLITIIPVVYSLNRGLWIGLGLAAGYVAFRLAAQGRFFAVIALAVVGVLGAVAFVASPLNDVVTARLESPHSNLTRSYTAQYTLEAALTSPIIGYGDTRPAQGGTQSIAIGQTPECQLCGNPTLGGNGQFWQVLLSQGLVGAALHVGFFLRTAWCYRRDRTSIGLAGMLGCLLPLLYMLLYNGLVVPLLLSFLSIALLWRNDTARQLAAQSASAPLASGARSRTAAFA